MEHRENNLVEIGKCFICSKSVYGKADDPMVTRPAWYWNSLICDSCRVTYPPALLKSCRDNWHYAMKVRDSKGIVEFTRAVINGPWVSVFDDDCGVAIDGLSFDRGVNIKISDIVWVADAFVNTLTG